MSPVQILPETSGMAAIAEPSRASLTLYSRPGTEFPTPPACSRMQHFSRPERRAWRRRRKSRGARTGLLGPS